MLAFVGWVFSPFALLITLHFFARRWTAMTCATLYVLMLCVAFGSILAYGIDATRQLGAHPATIYVLVPGFSIALIGLVLGIGSFVFRNVDGFRG